MRSLFLIIAVLLMLSASFGAGPALAAPPSAEELNKLKEDIASKRQVENSLKQQLNKTEDELNTLRRNLVKAAREQKDSEDFLTNLQERLDQLQKQEVIQRAALAEQQAKLSGVLVSLLRLSRTPPEVLLLRPDTPVDVMRSALLLRRALPFYAEKAQALSSKLEKLLATRQAILEKRQAILDAQKVYGEKQEKLNVLLTERQNWLKATESQRGDVTRQINELSAQAKNLQDLMNKVANSNLGTKSRPKTGGKLTFSIPVKGRLIYGFGDADDVGSDSRGVMLRVKAGQMITAPGDGQVVFAGPFKGYGNILILRHSDEYHSFLAGFGQMDVAVGQTVNAGEPLGRAAAEQGAASQLYFELRYKGAPIDPMRYIHKTNLAANDR